MTPSTFLALDIARRNELTSNYTRSFAPRIRMQCPRSLGTDPGRGRNIGRHRLALIC
jgi:hypothetical protein